MKKEHEGPVLFCTFMLNSYAESISRERTEVDAYIHLAKDQPF